MKKFRIETLGCKVNKYESDGIASDLVQKGFVRCGKEETADICIINTCAVTSKAGTQSRQIIRREIKQNPGAKIIVTGCHAQIDPEKIKTIEHIDRIVCQKDKFNLVSEIISPDDNSFKQPSREIFQSFDNAVKGEMTRAYLKIQDGCGSFCTYCIVPHARGPSVSMPEKKIFQHLEELNVSGFKEVILTGIHTGIYGRDFKKKSSLLNLLEKINRMKPVHRIRLSSIEPCEINEEIIELATKDNILCDHFHIPLQSGDDDILKKMKRPYDSSLFEETIDKIHKKLPLAGIGLDVLVGFPSETEKQFENTYNLVKKLPVSYLHVFPFSPRKGTPAYSFDNKVDSKIIRQRCAKMRQLDKIKKKAFIHSNLNKKTEALVQNGKDPKKGMLKAVTSNYLKVFLDKRPSLKGKIVDLIPERCDNHLNIIGKIIKKVGYVDMKDVYTKLASHLDNTPGGFPATESGVELKILRQLFTEEEARVALSITMIPEPPEVIAQKIDRDPEETKIILKEMGQKGLIFHIRKEGVDTFMLLQFAVGIWEYQVNRLTKKLIKDFNEYVPFLIEKQLNYKTKQLRVVPVSKAVNAELNIMDYERVENIIKSQSKIVVAPCICRKEHSIMGKGCDKIEEACLVFKGGAYIYENRNIGRSISQEEALEIMNRAISQGLVPQSSNSRKVVNLCFCCDCCCQILKNVKNYESPSRAVNSNFFAAVEQDKCTGCQACEEICPMEAVSRDEDQISKVDLERCIGCGLCVTKCDYDAISLKDKDASEKWDIPKNILETYQNILREKGLS